MQDRKQYDNYDCANIGLIGNGFISRIKKSAVCEAKKYGRETF
jgi:hypothetical protein